MKSSKLYTENFMTVKASEISGCSMKCNAIEAKNLAKNKVNDDVVLYVYLSLV
jgi:hypothetical protein